MPDISQKLWRRSARSLALSAALALCACAPNSTDLESRHDGTPASATTSENLEPQVCRPDRTLLVPPRAPDCAQFSHFFAVLRHQNCLDQRS